jgi:hypothetical protein
MATPAAAGAAAIVRQYFSLGYYPSGAPKSSDARNPSGALVKAMLIASASGMTGLWDDANKNDDNWKPMPAAPSFQEGWGRIDLERVLYFSDSVSQSLLVEEGNLTTGDEKTFEVKVTKGQKTFAVVIAWTDPPAQVSTTNALINDLDLEVTDPSGTTWKGNAAGVYGSSYIDRENNVEKVTAADPAEGTWTIKVKGFNVAVGGSQSYALVASGSPESSSRSGGRLSWWAIFFIVLAVVAVVALVVAGIIYLRRRSRPKFEGIGTPGDLQNPLLVNQ